MVEIRCPYCGFSKQVPREKIPANAKWAVCPKCRQRFELFQDIAFEKVGSAGENQGQSMRSKSPWERRDELGLWPALRETMKAVLFSPGRLFSTMSFKEGMKEPLAFGLLAGSLGSMLGFFWQLILMSLGVVGFRGPFIGHLGIWFVPLFMVVFVPIFVLIGIYISSAILHVLLLIVRGARSGFEATFRVVCYCQAAQVLGVVPFLGGWIAGIWQLVIQIIGLKEIHETSYLRVIVAFLIPLAFIVLLILAAIIPLVAYLLKGLSGPSVAWP